VVSLISCVLSPYLIAGIPKGPDGLKGPLDSSGSPVGCKSDCLVDPNPGDSPSCCSGSHNTPQTCPNSGVPNYSYFSTSFRFHRVASCVTLFFQSRGAPIHTCTHMMSQAGLHFGRAPHRPMRPTRSHSALKSSMGWVVFVYRNTCLLFIFSFSLQW
jgi:Thaumatin family